MDIALSKEILSSLNDASSYEWTERNHEGLYACSTSLGMNTKREHGLFVVPDISLKRKVVLLSKLEESVFIDNKLHEISTNNYSTGIFPSGYTYLEQFQINPFPTFTYHIEGRIIQKTLFLLSDKPLMVVRYELKNKGVPLNLIIKPFLANRFNTEISKEMHGLNTDSYVGQHFVRWALKPNMPEIYMYYSTGEFVPANLWYKNFEYPKDKGRFKEITNEHLFNPGFFQSTLTPYQAIDLYVSTKELDISQLRFEQLLRKEKEQRRIFKNQTYSIPTKRDRIEHELTHIKRMIGAKRIIPGSEIENSHTTRDLLFSLNGLFLATGDYEGFKKQYLDLLAQLNSGLLPVYVPQMRDNNHYCAADLSLWLINFGYDYFLQTGDIDFFADDIIDQFKDILEGYIKGTLNNIYMDRDGLIFSGSKSLSTSWIPLTDEENNVLRYGKLLEINALWYNALKIVEALYVKMGKKRKANKYVKLAEKARNNFAKQFTYAKSEFYDFVSNETKNTNFRINQLVLIALPFSIIEISDCDGVLDKINSALLTKYGLRSCICSENSKQLFENHNLHRKTSAYYNGGIWPWTIGLYADAVIKYSTDKPKSAMIINDILHNMEELADTGLINYLPETLNREKAINQSGIMDYTPSAAGFVWADFKVHALLERNEH